MMPEKAKTNWIMMTEKMEDREIDAGVSKWLVMVYQWLGLDTSGENHLRGVNESLWGQQNLG